MRLKAALRCSTVAAALAAATAAGCGDVTTNQPATTTGARPALRDGGSAPDRAEQDTSSRTRSAKATEEAPPANVPMNACGVEGPVVYGNCGNPETNLPVGEDHR